MIILQHNISYGGAAAESALVDIIIEVPVMLFTADADSQITRQFSGDTISVSFTQPADQTSYRAALPENFLTGATEESAAQAAQFFRTALTAGDLGALTVPVSVRYRTPDGQVLGEQDFEVLVLPKLILDVDPELLNRVRPTDARPAYFAVNKARFLELRAGLPAADDDALTLAAVSYLTQLVDDSPAFAGAAVARVATLLESRISAAAARQTVAAIKDAYGSLTDVPLVIPELKQLTIAGNLKVEAPDGITVTAEDFAVFEISAQWTDASDGLARVCRFRFGDQVTVTDNAAGFALTPGKPVYRSAVLGQVRVAAFGLDLSLWSQDLEPDDPTLAALQISVPLQAPTTLTAPPTAPPDANLRLRGRVLLLSQGCAAKDMLVLVQARATADGPWRVVGAAQADTVGNFGMPYPYGTYAQAQAICSAAPNEPADIPIVTAEGNQTISADFLYLLVRNPYSREKAPGDQDCGCGTGGPSRLPDFSDLIGSDTYSQDIGGSCVNLSRPNRTINEFNFQAIVRISDPDVATYRLTRLETGLEAIDVAQVAALAAATATLETRVIAALTATRENFQQMATVPASRILEAVEAAYPHVLAVKAAFAAGGPPVTVTVLAAAQSHLDAVIATLVATRDQLAADDFGFQTEASQVISAALTLRPLVSQGIDAAGTSVHYELTGATTARTRQPVGLANPVEWQAAPEPPAERRSLIQGDDHSLIRQAALAYHKAGLFLTPGQSAAPQPPGDASAEFAQAVSVATGHILHYKALFKADGYSLGDLVYSLPLAPGQKKEIVVFEASQTLVGAETQQLTQNERLAMGLVDERDITSRLAGGLTESLRGQSSANTSGISAGFGTGGQGYGGTGAYGGSGSAVIGVAGGAAQSASTASQDGSRDVAQFFGEKLRQSIMQNAEGYRQLNAAVVTTVQQGQRYGVTSEVIANHNHCHSLTIMYFEVLRHYAIFQELASVEECVFVPLLLARFSVDNIAAWRDLLAPALLPMPSETYLQPFVDMAGSGRQHPLIKAFDAVQRLRTNYANVDFPAGSYDEEPIRFVKGSMQVRVALPRPKTRYDRVKSLPVITKTVTTDQVDPAATAKTTWTNAVLAGLTGGFSTLFTGLPGQNVDYKTAQVEGKKAVFDAFMSLDANFENVPPAECMRVNNFNPGSITANGVTVSVSGLDFFKDGDEDRKQWELYATLLGYGDVLAMMTYYFQGRLISEWDDIFNNDIAPLVFDTIIDSVRLAEFGIDVTASRRYTGGEQLIAVNVSGTTSKCRNQLPQQLQLTVTSNAAQALRKYVTMTVEDVRLDYSTAHYHGPLYAGSADDDLLDGVSLDIPEGPDEKRNPRREDRYLAAALIEHLNSNLEYYNKVLWSQLDPDRRYMLLDGFTIQVYKADGTPVPGPAGMRSLASVVKNDVITVAGNSLVLPVAPGYRVSGSFVQAAAGGAAAPVSLFGHYQPLTPVEPYRVSVPSRGVFAEAVQGACNACEKIETDRLQDWSRFGTDEPTSIAPVSLPTPTLEDWKAAFRDFATPIVNVQNAPATPAPGAGLSGLSDLLTASGVFKDITGLDANQQNVLKTYLSNQDNAKAFAEMAKEMAMQSHNTQNSGKIMDSITAAKNSGAITQGDAGQLVKDHLQQQIDGGAGQKAAAEAQSQAAATPLSQAAVTAASQGKDVTASRLDSAGNSESVSISGPDTSAVLAEAGGTVPHLRQQKRRDCWAVAAAMMIGWSQKREITPADAVTAAGQKYLKIYTDDTGLFAEDKDDFLLRSRMVAEPAASYRLEQYVDWVKTYGPVWVTVDAAPGQEYSPHARVLIRISGTGTPDGVGTSFTLIDPATGTEVTQPFAEFIRGYEQLVTDNPASTLFPQVVHFIETKVKPEGYEIEGPFGLHEPVHETITLAALTRSTVPVPPGVAVGNDQASNEFLRGVLWNDDPAVLMFDENRTDNWRFSLGIAWLYKFEKAEHATVNDLANLTGRSHFFDLQFLHAMAEQADEEPGDTLAKIMLWAEVMYRLSIGEGISGTGRLDSVPVTSNVTVGLAPYSYSLSHFFNPSTTPNGTADLNYLLTLDTAYVSLDLGRRAIGSLLHTVQDSYALGHVRRTLANPGDRVPGTPDQFQPGTYGQYGAVENFHCYRGQDPALHDKYDKPASGTLRADDLNSFNSLLGARDAVNASLSLLNMWNSRTSWAAPGGPKEFLEGTVFKLAATASRADTNIVLPKDQN